MAPATSIKGARVLIVEDEYMIADDLARAMREAGGEPVGPVSTLEQAEEILGQAHVDAAIFDLDLRGKMAFDLIEKLVTPGLPCLIVSGYGDDVLPETLDGISRLEKPVNPKTVIEKLDSELGVARRA